MGKRPHRSAKAHTPLQHKTLMPQSSTMAEHPIELRTDLGLITYLFYGFDGKLFIRGNSSLSWHSDPRLMKNPD